MSHNRIPLSPSHTYWLSVPECARHSHCPSVSLNKLPLHNGLPQPSFLPPLLLSLLFLLIFFTLLLPSLRLLYLLFLLLPSLLSPPPPACGRATDPDSHPPLSACAFHPRPQPAFRSNRQILVFSSNHSRSVFLTFEVDTATLGFSQARGPIGV